MLFTLYIGSLNSCSEGHRQEEPEIVDLNQAIVGKWEATQIRIRAEWFTVTGHDEFSISANYGQDHTYRATGPIIGGEGIYSITDSILTVTNDEDNSKLFVAKINSMNRSEQELTVTYFSNRKDKVQIRLKKVQ
jgi:hypothetical protein